MIFYTSGRWRGLHNNYFISIILLALFYWHNFIEIITRPETYISDPMLRIWIESEKIC